MFLPSNGYSLYCAELMVNMKDVPSTERMVLCSKQWKMMTQKEKDMFQKRCEQVCRRHAPDCPAVGSKSTLASGLCVIFV